jgi:Mn2+/Fe2+ NRAMP family transporter
LLAVMMLVANNHKIMGSDRNGPLLNLAGWATTGAMALAAAGLFVFWGK